MPREEDIEGEEKEMLTVWLLVVLQTTGVYSNRAAHGFQPLATFVTQQECIDASKQLVSLSSRVPDELGVRSIIGFECLKEVIK